MENRINVTIRFIIATTLSLAGIFGSLHLMSQHIIGELSLVSLFFGSVVFGVFIFFSNRVEFLELGGMTVKLRKIEKIQKDVIAREEHIRKTALLLGEITLFSSTTSGILFTPVIRELRRSWYESKVKELMSLISAQPEERAKVFKFLHQFNETYTNGIYDPAKKEAGWEKFWGYASDDIK